MENQKHFDIDGSENELELDLGPLKEPFQADIWESFWALV